MKATSFISHWKTSNTFKVVGGLDSSDDGLDIVFDNDAFYGQINHLTPTNAIHLSDCVVSYESNQLIVGLTISKEALVSGTKQVSIATDYDPNSNRLVIYFGGDIFQFKTSLLSPKSKRNFNSRMAAAADMPLEMSCPPSSSSPTLSPPSSSLQNHTHKWTGFQRIMASPTAEAGNYFLYGPDILLHRDGDKKLVAITIDDALKYIGTPKTESLPQSTLPPMSI
jgi:hypothetical protein